MLLISSATASEITGAFGVEFGATVDINNYKQVGIDGPYGQEFSFIPENPYGPLTDYSVFVTPQTHRAYQVSASAKFTSMKACRRVLSDLETSLEKKYDKTSKKIREDFGSTPKISFGKSSRTIEGICTASILKKRLKLIYTDKKLRELAGQEYQQLQQSNKQPNNDHDTSGL